jgi:hypothetical protein
VWVFDLAWALAIFFGLHSLAARLLAVRIGALAAVVCGALGLGVGFGLQRAVAGDSGGVAPMRPSPCCHSWRRWLSSRCLA